MPAGSQIVYTPMGLVPQPALGVFLVLAWQAELPRVRVVGRWIALLALAAAGIDAAGGMGTSALVIGGMGAAYLIGEFLRHTQFVDHSPRDDQDDSNEGLSRKLPRLSFLDKNGSEEAEPPRQQQRPGPGGTAKRPAGKKWDI
jgi:hypothetical protein